MADDDTNVQVFCRVRPPNEREGAFAKSACVSVLPDARSVVLASRHAAARTFTFDRAFSEHAAQHDVFAAAGAPITRACLEGYNGTIFAYGQTGSGKTFTMQGPDHVIAEDAHELRGLVPRVFDFLFHGAAATSSHSNTVEHTFACSFLEIYNERVYDLLDGGGSSTKDATTGLALRENGRKGVFVDGLVETVVTSAAQAAQLMAVGAQNRRVGQTAMNRESSRSHSVFMLQIQSRETTADGVTRVRSSRFNLVDLAGSERQRRTEAAGERLKEAGSINKSLSALGNVIMGLVEQSAGKARHVHYRDSKLTFLLKDSLGGNAKTSMIATVSPAEDSSHETLSTLKFAQRAKLVRNNAVINEDSTGSVLVLQEEIQRLRRQLHETTQLSLVPQAPLVVAEPTGLGTSSLSLVAPCDPATDSRFRDLEAAFAASVEKNGQLKRSTERLKLQEEHLKALGAEMKRTITHLRMLARLRQHRPSPSPSSSSRSTTVASDELEKDGVVDYEPSVDAIEWRVKYEELEESYAELQDELQQRRIAEHEADGRDRGYAENEVERLNLMLHALTKQLASVVRDKHELQDRLARVSTLTTSDDSADDAAAVRQALKESDRRVVELREAMATQAYTLTARATTALAARDAAAAKTHEAALELLAMKQKEAAWSIQVTERDIRLQDCARLLRQAEDARVQAGNALTVERQQHDVTRVQASHELASVRLTLDATLADARTTQQQLEHQLRVEAAAASELREARDALADDVRALSAQIDTLTVDVAARDEQLVRQSRQDALEREQERAHASGVQTAMEHEHRVALEEKREELAALARRFETAMQNAADEAAEAKRTHEDRVRTLESAAAALERDYEHTRSSLNAAEHRVAQLENDTSVLQRDLTSAEVTAAELAQQIREQQAALERHRQKIAALEATRDDLVREREQLRAAAREQTAALAALEQSEAERTHRCDRLEADVAALTTQLSAATVRAHALEEELATERAQSAAASDAHRKAVAALETAHATEFEAFARQTTELQCAHDVELRSVERAKLALEEAFDSQCAVLEHDLGAARQQATERANEVTELKRALADAATESDRLVQAMHDERHTLEQLNAELVKREQAIATLEQSQAELTQQLGTARSREEGLTEELACAQEELVTASEEHRVAVARLQEAHAAAVAETTQTAATEIVELNDRLSASVRSLEASTATERELNDSLLASQRSNDELSAVVADLRSKLERVEQAAREEEVARSTLKQQLEARSSKLKEQSVRSEADRQAAATEIAELNDRLSASVRSLEASTATERELNDSLLASQRSNDELSAVVADLRSKLERVEQAAREEEVARSTLKQQLEERASELERRSVRAEADRQATAKERQALESTKADYRKCKLRVAELEPLVAQLRSDRQRLERECQLQAARLENVTKANDKLVGHDNKRQKIQYHVKVKEENNRLLGEVRQLTDDKFRLQTKLDKLRLALKEKENVGEGVGVATRPASASSAASSANTKAAASASVSRAPSVKKLVPVTAGLGGLETSSLATAQPTKKRLHSRIERYSSFGDDDANNEEENEKRTGDKAKAKASARKQHLLDKDNENESEGEVTAPERTTASDSRESKVFLRAVYHADMRTIQDLLTSGDASVTTADQHGWSGLHWAASQGHTKILELLLKKGASVDAVEHINGWTPLHVAAVRELLPCVQLLLRAGASARINDKYGDSASDLLRCVRGKKREKVLQVLLQFAPRSGA